MESVFDTYRTDPELTIKLVNGVYLSVAKVGGGTLFKEYSGKWLVQASIFGESPIFSEVWDNPNQINHYDALRQTAEHVLDEYDDHVRDALDDFVTQNNYEIV